VTVKRYQVVGECAHVVVTDLSGVSSMTLLYKGAFLPDNVEEKRLQHLLDTRLVAEVVDEPIAPNAALDQDPAVGIPPLVQPASGVDPDEQARRDEAAAKLDDMGGIPDGRSSEAVWVEYAVRQGLDRDEARKAGKEELRKALAK
jgi:hypothetical protein